MTQFKLTGPNGQSIEEFKESLLNEVKCLVAGRLTGLKVEAVEESAKDCAMKMIRQSLEKRGRRGAFNGISIEDYSDADCRDLVYYLLYDHVAKLRGTLPW